MKKIEKEKENHTYKLGTKINKEVFDETYLSDDDSQYVKPKNIILCNQKTATTVLIMTCISSHSLFEGILIGTLQSPRLFIIVYLVILQRKIEEAFSIVSNYLYYYQ